MALIFGVPRKRLIAHRILSLFDGPDALLVENLFRALALFAPSRDVAIRAAAITRVYCRGRHEAAPGKVVPLFLETALAPESAKVSGSAAVCWARVAVVTLADVEAAAATSAEDVAQLYARALAISGGGSDAVRAVGHAATFLPIPIARRFSMLGMNGPLVRLTAGVGGGVGAGSAMGGGGVGDDAAEDARRAAAEKEVAATAAMGKRRGTIQAVLSSAKFKELVNSIKRREQLSFLVLFIFIVGSFAVWRIASANISAALTHLSNAGLMCDSSLKIASLAAWLRAPDPSLRFAADLTPLNLSSSHAIAADVFDATLALERVMDDLFIERPPNTWTVTLNNALLLEPIGDDGATSPHSIWTMGRQFVERGRVIAAVARGGANLPAAELTEMSFSFLLSNSADLWYGALVKVIAAEDRDARDYLRFLSVVFVAAIAALFSTGVAIVAVVIRPKIAALLDHRFKMLSIFGELPTAAVAPIAVKSIDVSVDDVDNSDDDNSDSDQDSDRDEADAIFRAARVRKGGPAAPAALSNKLSVKKRAYLAPSSRRTPQRRAAVAQKLSAHATRSTLKYLLLIFFAISTPCLSSVASFALFTRTFWPAVDHVTGLGLARCALARQNLLTSLLLSRRGDEASLRVRVLEAAHETKRAFEAAVYGEGGSAWNKQRLAFSLPSLRDVIFVDPCATHTPLSFCATAKSASTPPSETVAFLPSVLGGGGVDAVVDAARAAAAALGGGADLPSTLAAHAAAVGLAAPALGEGVWFVVDDTGGYLLTDILMQILSSAGALGLLVGHLRGRHAAFVRRLSDENKRAAELLVSLPGWVHCEDVALRAMFGKEGGVEMWGNAAGGGRDLEEGADDDDDEE